MIAGKGTRQQRQRKSVPQSSEQQLPRSCLPTQQRPQFSQGQKRYRFEPDHPVWCGRQFADSGYLACTFCCSRGIWDAGYNKVLYPYANNDLRARTHVGYLKAAREVRKSTGGEEVAVDRIKRLASLLQIFNYPTQIIYDCIHLVCLGHIPSLINRWCSRIDKNTILKIDNKLQQLGIPHNMKVGFLESIKMASQWKAKKSRLFVSHVGVPIMATHLPTLLVSHFVIFMYCRY
ncbi:unnamed protein product [Didymodactylos carnosus]|uniref:Uncharacterized protein n=1 Tax=Didymodactylos carnosus TaxID=1234261 RepID=A0A814JWH2_9BILA|nr:unnamed protein product [Didymodactylos carnosus]CAF3813030.1 unnamed protein product [Didymodactylos carnosus]